MVKGLDLFQKHFAEFTDRYVLIGGTASSLSMDALGVDFRLTKDLDIVLIVEALDGEFVQAFWEFVGLGNYANQQRSTGKRLFYRFSKPANPDYPFMLELFSRIPDAIDIADGSNLTPIPIDDEVSSLSAILMNEDYYRFILDRRKVVDGLSIIGAEALIPLKASAYADLSMRKDQGEKVDSKHIKKHKNDIFRLYTILELGNSIPLPKTIRDELSATLQQIREDSVDLKALNIRGKSNDEILDDLAKFYGM